MKNQLMTVDIFNQSITIEHGTAYGSLSSLFDAGNQLRLQEGKKFYTLQTFLRNKDVQERISILADDPTFHLDERGAVYKTGRGGSTRTMAHIMVMVLGAQKLSSRFHYEFDKKVITSNLMGWRDESGEQFKAFNILVEQHLLEKGDPKNRWFYIECAKKIGLKVFGDKWEAGMWNNATASDLKLRADYETKLVSFLEMGYIKTKDDLRDAIEKL